MTTSSSGDMKPPNSYSGARTVKELGRPSAARFEDASSRRLPAQSASTRRTLQTPGSAAPGPREAGGPPRRGESAGAEAQKGGGKQGAGGRDGAAGREHRGAA